MDEMMLCYVTYVGKGGWTDAMKMYQTVTYTITHMHFVCPDLLNPVGETSYGIRGVVHRITQFPLFVY
jgi:hypothetical protein